MRSVLRTVGWPESLMAFASAEASKFAASSVEEPVLVEQSQCCRFPSRSHWPDLQFAPYLNRRPDTTEYGKLGQGKAFCFVISTKNQKKRNR